MTLVEVTYIVKRPFSYSGVEYARGDEWVPGGSKHDDYIKSVMCYRIEESQKNYEAAPKKRGRPKKEVA